MYVKRRHGYTSSYVQHEMGVSNYFNATADLPPRKVLQNYSAGSQFDPRAGLYVVEERKISCSCLDPKPDPLADQPVPIPP
jgi:hypothetical protein